MNKLGLFLLTLAILLVVNGCSYNDPVIYSLPDYNSKAFYTSGGFQDYTDYAKYTYESITVQDLESSKYFHAIDAEDVEEIHSYIENFEGWVEIIGGELQENYDFDKSIVSEGDFLCIDQGEFGKFNNYTVYYFDIDTQTLYYFHNNI